MRHLSLLIIAVLLAFGVNALAHEAELDADGGHLYEASARYHFHTDDGSYEPNPEEVPANTLVGPWVFTVIPGNDSAYPENITKDALAAYTDGALTETALEENGIDASVHKGHGWRLDWEIGFLKEDNPTCEHNIPEIAGHLAVLEANSNYFYAVMKFNADRTARTTVHLHWQETARGWLNGVEFFRSVGWPEGDEGMPEHPQALVREGENLLVVKVGRGWNNCGCAPTWMVTVGLKPHTPTRITVPFVYEDGGVTVDYFSDSTDIHDINGDGVVNILDIVMIANAIGAPAAPSVARQPKLTTWAALKRR